MYLHSAIFYTHDLDQAAQFYKDQLHFDLDYMQENRFASFNLGNAKLGIKQAKESREVPGHQTIFISVPNIEEAYREAQANNCNILKPLTQEDWATNFSLLDPDGNKVQFLQNNKNTKQ